MAERAEAELAAELIDLESRLAEARAEGHAARIAELEAEIAAARELLESTRATEVAESGLGDARRERHAIRIANLEEEIEALEDRLLLSSDDEETARINNELARIRLRLQIAIAEAAGESTTELKRELAELLKKQETNKKILSLVNSITGGLVEQIKKTFTLNGILTSISSISKEIMESNVEYAKSTGQIADNSTSFGMNLSQYGIGYAKLNKASAELFNSFSSFSELSRDTRESITETAAKMENLGVSAAIAGKFLDDSVKGFGMSISQAESSFGDLAKAAMGANISVSKMMNDWSAATSTLAAYNATVAKQTFIDLEKQSKSLGIEMGKLTGIVGDMYDTFEGSAKAASGLNAVLGGNYLNSVEMLNATESERIVLLKEAMDASGKSWESMSKFEKKAIAARIGISDLNDANKLFTKSTSQMTIEMQKQAADQKKLEETQAAATKVLDKLSNSFNSLMIILKPVVYVITWAIDTFAMLNDKMKGIPGIILAIIPILNLFSLSWRGLRAAMTPIGPIGTMLRTVFTGIWGAITRAASAIWTKILALTGLSIATRVSTTETTIRTEAELAEAEASTLATTTTGRFSAALTALSTAGKGAMLALIGIGIAAVGIGAGIMFAAYGLAELVKSFKGLGGAQAFAAVLGITAVTVAILFMVKAIAAITFTGIGPIALAFLAVLAITFVALGAAVWLAGKGMAIFVEAFRGLTLESAAVMLAFSVSIWALSHALTSLATVGLPGVGVLALIAAIVGALSISITFMSNSIANAANALVSLFNIFTVEKLKIFTDYKDALSGLKTDMDALAASLNDLTGTKTIQFNFLEDIPEGKVDTIKAFQTLITTVKTTSSEQLKPTKDFVQVIKQFYEVQARSKDADKDALIQVLKEGLAKLSPNNEKEKQIILQIKGSEFRDALNGKSELKGTLIRDVGYGFSPSK